MKEVIWALPSSSSEIEIDLRITPQLQQEGLTREVIRHIQNARKEAGLQVDDRIHLNIVTNSSNLDKVVVNYKTEIMHETLSKSITRTEQYAHKNEVSVDDEELTISLEKAN